MIGNRDFLLSHKFETETGCKLINEPYELEHNAQKFLLIHGDSLCTDDINYQKLKKFLEIHWFNLFFCIYQKIFALS